jgi:hypothetical protein
MFPSGRYRAKSPVRYSRSPGAHDWVRDEPLGGERRLVEVPRGQAVAAGPQLAADADRNRLQVRVEDVDAQFDRRPMETLFAPVGSAIG